MDFSKLNLEFASMQNTISKYNEIVLIIKNKIRSNEKEINKLDTKIRNTKNMLEKDCYKLLLDSMRNENLFYKTLIESDDKNEKNIQ